METKKRASHPGEFRLVLSPNRRAGSRARQAVRQRFSERLPSATLTDLITVVTELVNNSVQHGPGKPITVTLVVSGKSIRGESRTKATRQLQFPRSRKRPRPEGEALPWSTS